MPETIQSLWHGRVLIGVMESLYAMRGSLRRWRVGLVAHFVDFLQTYDVERIPPFVVKGLGFHLSNFAIQLPAGLERHMRQKLVLFDMIAELQCAVWGGLDRHLHTWRLQCQMVSAQKSGPALLATSQELLRWWGEVHTPMHVQSPEYPIGVMLLGGDGGSVQFRSLLALLQEITERIASDRDLFEEGATGELNIRASAPAQGYFWAALARTIAYNLFFFGDARIRLSPSVWENSCESKADFCSDSEQLSAELAIGQSLGEWKIPKLLSVRILAGNALTRVADDEKLYK